MRFESHPAHQVFTYMRNRTRKPALYWKQRLGFEEKPYLIRWMLAWLTGVFLRCAQWSSWVQGIPASVRLHHWRGSDDDRFPHDHEWWFLTIVLKGGYIDRTPVYDADGVQTGWRDERLTAGDIRFRGRDHRHYVHLEPGQTAWTLLVTGPPLREFGFWLSATKRINSKRYFFRFGHHSPFPGGTPRKTVKVREGLSLGGGKRPGREHNKAA